MNVVAVLMMLLAAAGSFVLLRTFVLWYFKVNELLNTLKSIDTKLGEKR